MNLSLKIFKETPLSIESTKFGENDNINYHIGQHFYDFEGRLS
jgi:hypothetical protein